jgi:hypothetical protein
MLEGRPPTGIKSEALIRLHLALIVPQESPLESGEQLWKQDRIHEALIALPAEEGICRYFQQHLSRLGVDWFTSVEVSGLRLVETYVANCHGIGLGLAVPRIQRIPGVRAIPLEDFPEIVVGALWVGKRTAVMDCVVSACHDRAKMLGGSG